MAPQSVRATFYRFQLGGTSKPTNIFYGGYYDHDNSDENVKAAFAKGLLSNYRTEGWTSGRGLPFELAADITHYI